MDLENLLSQEEYGFLNKDIHLKDRILFLSLSGSYAYGTNVEGSDIDIRGVALDRIDSLIGIDRFEQYNDKKTDTTVYSLSKFVSLALACNPNVIELLFLKPEHYLSITPIGQKLLDNRHLFLSQRAIPAFGGYANAQLNRLENALMREKGEQSDRIKAEHMKRSMENCITSFLDNEDVDYSFTLDYDEVDSVTKVDLSVKGLRVGAFRSLGNQMGDVLKTYDALSLGKNARRDDLHLNKHMMHLVRLYLTANELLETGSFHAYREKDIDLLLAIRRGEYRNEDGSLKESFGELLKGLTSRFDELKKHPNLPKQPDRDGIANLLKEIYESALF